jgi:hypothetical protein
VKIKSNKMKDLPNPYDLSGCRRYIEQHKNDKARERYIGKRMSQLRNRDEGINPYDLSQIAQTTRIHNEAERIFG